MLTSLIEFVSVDVFRFQTDRFLSALLCLMIVVFFFEYASITASKRGKRLFWLGTLLWILAMGMTIGLSCRNLPRGVSGTYYSQSYWTGNPVDSLRYFETPGQRVDRFLDFNPNDLNNRYPFSGKPFSIKWEGSILSSAHDQQLHVNSNFGTWLYLDDRLIEGPHKIDFGRPEARVYLRDGWSGDEQLGYDPNRRFIWSMGTHSDFYLGVDESADYLLLFRCMPFSFEASPQQRLSIFVDGELVETITLQQDWQTYGVKVPRSLLQDRAPGFFRVQFRYSDVFRPSEVLKNSTDGRQLAVAFDAAAMLKAPAAAAAAHYEPMLTEEFQPYRLSKGMHRLLLKAQSNGENPFVQLLWRRGQQAFVIVPEDALLPKNSDMALVTKRLPGEKILLNTIIVVKVLGVIFIGAALLIMVVPTYWKSLLTRDNLLVLGICVLAFGVRLAFLLEKTQFDLCFYHLPLRTDQLSYVFFARGFLRGYWPGLSHGPFYFNPLISLYYIFCSFLFGESLFVARLVTSVLASLSIGLIFSIARRCFNRPVAYLAALFCTCNGLLIFYDTSLLIAPVLTVLGSVSVWLSLKLREEPSWRIAIALGASVGLAALARANLLLFMPILLLWILFAFSLSGFKKLALYLVICLALALTILPVSIRNYYSRPEHPLVLITSGGGINLWIGNNPSATGAFSFSGRLLAEARARMKKNGTSYFDEVLHYISHHPRQYLQLEWKKLILFWRGHEISNLLPYYIYQQNSTILRLPWLNFVLIGPLGLVGMLAAFIHWRRAFLLYGSVFVHIGSALLFLVLGRYRILVVPVLSIFAAYLLWQMRNSLQRRQWTRFGAALGGVALFYYLLNYPYAAHLYQNHYGEPMPLLKLLRYWELFHPW